MTIVPDESNSLRVLTYNILRKHHRPELLEAFVKSIPLTEVDFVALQEVCSSDLEVLRNICTKAPSSPFEIVAAESQQTGYNVILVNTSRQWLVLSRVTCPCILPMPPPRAPSASPKSTSKENEQDWQSETAASRSGDSSTSSQAGSKTFDVAFAFVARHRASAAAQDEIVCIASYHTPGGQTAPGDDPLGKTRKAQNVVILSTIVEHAAATCLKNVDKISGMRSKRDGGQPTSSNTAAAFTVSCVAVGDGNFQQLGKKTYADLKTEFATALALGSDTSALSVMPGFKGQDDLAEYGGFAIQLKVDPESSHRVKHVVTSSLATRWSYTTDIKLVNSDHEPAYLTASRAPRNSTMLSASSPDAPHKKTGQHANQPAEPEPVSPAPRPAAGSSDSKPGGGSGKKQSPPSQPPSTTAAAAAGSFVDDESSRSAAILQLQGFLSAPTEKDLAEKLGYANSSSISTFKKKGAGPLMDRAREALAKANLLVDASTKPLHEFLVPPK